MEQEIEIWKDVIGYEEFYQISSYGRFKKKKRVISENKPGMRIIEEVVDYGFFMGKSIPRRFYASLSLKNKKNKVVGIHRLVALHFLEKDQYRNHVNHKDGNVLNNHYSNLEWVTNMENQHHGQLNKSFISKYHGVGYQKRNNKWYSRIYLNGKRIRIGTFNSEIEAFEARKKIEIENNIIDKYRIE